MEVFREAVRGEGTYRVEAAVAAEGAAVRSLAALQPLNGFDHAGVEIE